MKKRRYTTNEWVLLCIDNIDLEKDEFYFRILADMPSADVRFKLSSKIIEVMESEKQYLFKTFNGSVYVCEKSDNKLGPNSALVMEDIRHAQKTLGRYTVDFVSPIEVKNILP